VHHSGESFFSGHSAECQGAYIAVIVDLCVCVKKYCDINKKIGFDKVVITIFLLPVPPHIGQI